MRGTPPMDKNKWIALTATLDNISEWSGRIFSFIVVPLTLLVVFEVVARRVFGKPTIWSFELSNFLFGSHFMLVAAYGLLHKSHVSIDIFSSRLSPKRRELMQLAGYFLFFFPFLIALLVYGIQVAAISWTIGEESWSAWHPPLYPVKTVIPITASLLIIQGISDVIKKIIILKGEK
jgi:TRAP-type mannitol/chloroaromatic compound transport system permease small subunit